MKQGMVLAGLAVAVVVAGAWVTAAQDAPPTAAAPAVGRFLVLDSRQATVMVDTVTGLTWVLERSATGAEHAWLPTRKLDDLKDARKWQTFQKLMRKQMEEKGHR